MRRGGVLALLGEPDGDEKGAESGLETERMLFKGPDQTAFSVLLAGGLVVDVMPGSSKAPGLRPFVLPSAVPDASVGTDLRIGSSPNRRMRYSVRSSFCRSRRRLRDSASSTRPVSPRLDVAWCR